MNTQTICRCVIASILSVTAASWAQTSVSLGRVDYKDNCASCHGADAHGSASLPRLAGQHAQVRLPRFDLGFIDHRAQRHGEGVLPCSHARAGFRLA